MWSALDVPVYTMYRSVSGDLRLRLGLGGTTQGASQPG